MIELEFWKLVIGALFVFWAGIWLGWNEAAKWFRSRERFYIENLTRLENK